MARRRRKSWAWPHRALLALAAIPAIYLFAALIGSLAAVNRGWTEPERGITIYLADNGIHSDIIMPARVGGLDWAPLVPKEDFAAPDSAARWVAFGSGEERVYLETPRWRDIKPRTIWSGLAGGKRVMHVEWVADPSYAVREVRLRPEEYRRSGKQSAPTSAAGPAHRPSRLRPLRHLLLGDRQSQRDPHLQQLGRRPAAAGRGQDQPVAALRPGPDMAVPKVRTGYEMNPQIDLVSGKS